MPEHSRQIFESSVSLFSPSLVNQSSCRILTTHAKARPILHDDWSIRLGENRPYKSSKKFGDYALSHLLHIQLGYDDESTDKGRIRAQ